MSKLTLTTEGDRHVVVTRRFAAGLWFLITAGIGEAMASGCIVVAANDAVRAVSEELFVADISAEQVANRISKAISLSEHEHSALRQSSESFIAREHSLSLLCERLIPLLSQ